MGSWYDERREAQARAYDRAQAVLFLVRFALLFALAAVFWLSGWSRALAGGLRAGLAFPFGWALVHAAFVALAVFGYEAVLFPLSVLAGYSLERVHGRLESEFGSWLRGYLGTLMLEMGLATAGFTGLYARCGCFPRCGGCGPRALMRCWWRVWGRGDRRSCCRACVRRFRSATTRWRRPAADRRKGRAGDHRGLVGF